MDALEIALRNRDTTQQRVDKAPRRPRPTPSIPKNKPARPPVSPEEASSLVIRDHYATAPEKVTLGGLVVDYTKASLHLGFGAMKLLPGVGTVINAGDTVWDAFKLSACINANGLLSQATFKATVDLGAHAIGIFVPTLKSIASFYDVSKAMGDFFDAGANTVNYVADAPRMRTSPALQVLSGAFGAYGLQYVAAKNLASKAVQVGSGLTATSALSSAAGYTALGAAAQTLWRSVFGNRQLPRAGLLSE